MTELVQTFIEAGVKVIRLNRPDKKNALVGEMYAAMADALARGEADDEVGVFLFRGSDTDFSAGNDLPYFLSWDKIEGSDAEAFIHAIVSTKKPVVVAVRGAAVGIGVTMLPHCDLVYAAPDTRFQMPFVNLGLVPEAGSTQTITELAGHRRAAEMMLMGEAFGVDVALAIGLINQVLPSEELEAFALARARALAAKPREAVLKTKALMRRGPEPLADRLVAEARVFDQCLKSPELAEAVAAFREKRAPDFSKCR